MSTTLQEYINQANVELAEAKRWLGIAAELRRRGYIESALDANVIGIEHAAEADRIIKQAAS